MSSVNDNGEVSLTIGGASYTFIITTASMVSAEEYMSTPAVPAIPPMTGPNGQILPGKPGRPAVEVTWDEIVERMMRGSAKAFVVFVWAMLRKHHRQMTVDDAATLIDTAGGADGLRRTIEAVRGSMSPDPEDVKEIRPRKARTKKRSVGGRST